MKYAVTILALMSCLLYAQAASAQSADTLAGSGTHAQGNGKGADGLGRTVQGGPTGGAHKGTVGDTGVPGGRSEIGGNTSPSGFANDGVVNGGAKSGVNR